MEVEYSWKSEEGLNSSQVAERAYENSKEQGSNDGEPVVTSALGEK